MSGCCRPLLLVSAIFNPCYRGAPNRNRRNRSDIIIYIHAGIPHSSWYPDSFSEQKMPISQSFFILSPIVLLHQGNSCILHSFSIVSSMGEDKKRTSDQEIESNWFLSKWELNLPLNLFALWTRNVGPSPLWNTSVVRRKSQRCILKSLVVIETMKTVKKSIWRLFLCMHGEVNSD